MKILRDDEVEMTRQTQVYREVAWDQLVFGLVMGVIGLGAAVAPFLTQSWDVIWVDVLCLLAFLLFGSIARLSLNAYRASTRSANWLVKLSPSALYLRFRSFHNYTFPAEAPSVVQLDHREVNWVRGHSQKRQVQDSDGNWSGAQTVKGVEIGLRNTDAAPLSAALGEEATLRDYKGARVNDYPVSLRKAEIIRLKARNPRKALELLDRYFPKVRDEQIPMTKFTDMSQNEKEDHIVDLLQAGQKMDAIKAARQVYGYDLREAKEFVEGLMTR